METGVIRATCAESAIARQVQQFTQPNNTDEGDSNMPRYLISFDDGSMDHIPEED